MPYSFGASTFLPRRLLLPDNTAFLFHGLRGSDHALRSSAVLFLPSPLRGLFGSPGGDS
jgi:hypothetical protein